MCHPGRLIHCASATTFRLKEEHCLGRRHAGKKGRPSQFLDKTTRDESALQLSGSHPAAVVPCVPWKVCVIWRRCQTFWLTLRPAAYRRTVRREYLADVYLGKWRMKTDAGLGWSQGAKGQGTGCKAG